MKNTYFLLLFFVCTYAAAQKIDRSKRPEPSAAPTIKIGQAESFELPNGLMVFVVENHKLPRVSFSLILDYDPLFEGNKAGYVEITGELLSRGTKNRTKDQLDEEIDFIGASLITSARGLNATSLRKHSEKLVELMSDVLLNPSFSQEELDKIKKQTLSGLAHEKEDPEAIANNVAGVLVYGKDHPYGEIQTEEKVKNVTLQDCKNHYQKFFKPNISYLAIVGDINKREAEVLVKKHFSSWERGDVPKNEIIMPPSPQKRVIAIVDRPNAVQSNLDFTYPIRLSHSDPDVIKVRLLNHIFGGPFTSRLFSNLREKHGYTYGAYSSLSPDRYVSRFSATAQVRNDVTDSAVAELINEFDLIRKEKVKEEELQGAKNYVTGSFARSLENPETVASFAINTSRYNLPKNFYSDYLKNIQLVTIDDIKAASDKYLNPDKAYVLVVGKAEEVTQKLARYGEVRHFDIYGNPIDKSAKIIPTGISAEQIYNNYVKAIGGKENLKKIKDLTWKLNLSVQGAELKMTRYDKAPNKTYMVATMGGNEALKMVYDGTKGYQTQMGQRQDLSGKELEKVKIESTLNYEMFAKELGLNLKLLELMKLEGKDVYKVEMTTPGGNRFLQFFDKETGLKVREEKSIESSQGASTHIKTYADYRDVNGVKLPFRITESIATFSMDFQVETVEANKGLKDDLFVVK